ncbi:MAG: type II secretion system F family protein [Rhodocyclales bacterium]|nr:type II secretion system F family protein [Rhodocyclales bacterium]
MRFEIKALHPRDGVVLRSLEASSTDDARMRISADGLEVISIQQRWRYPGSLRRQVTFDILQFSHELRSLLDAGLSLIEALGALARKEQTPERRNVIDELIRDLREGKPFSMAVRAKTATFPPLYVALISASERTGGLSEALRRFIAYREQMDIVRERIKAGAIYPALLVCVGGLVIAFLMIYVVPRFSRIYEDFGRDLPWMSKLLMQWGTLVQDHGAALAISLVLLVGGAIWTSRKQKLAARLWRTLSSGSSLRHHYQAFVLARFYRTLGMLVQSGIPIVGALELARILLDHERQLSLDGAISKIRAGAALSAAMEESGLAPAVASDLLKVGEKSGDVGEKMIRIADFLDDDTSRWIEWFVKLFEPLLMLGIGLFIALIVVLLYLPIFELAGSLQ